MSTFDLEAVFELRKRFWANGYRPIEIWSPDQRVDDRGEPLNSPGKQPRGRWREDAAQDPPAAARTRPDPRALNTGLLSDEAIGFDVDILDPVLSERITEMIVFLCGETPLVRIGLAPKTLLVFRAEKAFSKLQTPEMILPNGQKAKVEVLAKGQQFVADGIHPDTGKPYTWVDESPETVHFSMLPVVTEAQASEVIRRAEQLLREAGAKRRNEKAPPKPKNNGRAGTFFDRVNNAALADIAAWARALFPRARFEPGTAAWRVSSKDLGRDLEEDISIHPTGICDFGEEIPLAAIDLVMDHAGRTAIEAALWLCDRLSIDPATLGYTPPPPKEAEGVSLDDFYAYMVLHNYVFAPSRDLWPASSVNARISPIPIGPPDENGEQETIKPSIWLDQNKPVEQMTWAPGLPMIIQDRLISEGGWIERKGVSCFNLYRPPSIKPGDPAKARPWVDHVNKVYPDDAAHIIRWLAHRVQDPADKLNHALVLGGLQGIGKDTLLEPVKRAVGPWNFAEPSPTQLMGRFNGFAKSVILRISEAHDLGDVDRYQFYEHLKVYAAAPRDVLRIDEKHLREYNVLNCCAVIITTNHKINGLYLPADDRRHYVAWSSLTKGDFNKAYWDKLWSWYDNGGDHHVAAYLVAFDLDTFNPKAPPPKTEAFWTIVNAGRSPEDAELADCLDHLNDPDATTVAAILRAAEKLFPPPPPGMPGAALPKSDSFADWLKERRNRRTISHRFEACGYVPIRNPDADDGLWRISGKRIVVYTKEILTIRDQIAAARKLQ